MNREPSIDAMRDRFLECWARATDAELEAGAAWYPRARGLSRRLGSRHGIGWRRTAGVIAALSPQLQWRANLEAAELALQDPDAVLPTLRLTEGFARAILAGARPLEVLRGPKSRAFYRALCGDTGAPVIDRWMLAAAGWHRDGLSHAQYARVARALEAAAADALEPVTSLQATVWIVRRGAAD